MGVRGTDFGIRLHPNSSEVLNFEGVTPGGQYLPRGEPTVPQGLQGRLLLWLRGRGCSSLGVVAGHAGHHGGPGFAPEPAYVASRPRRDYVHAPDVIWAATAPVKAAPLVAAASPVARDAGTLAAPAAADPSSGGGSPAAGSAGSNHQGTGGSTFDRPTLGAANGDWSHLRCPPNCGSTAPPRRSRRHQHQRQRRSHGLGPPVAGREIRGFDASGLITVCLYHPLSFGPFAAVWIGKTSRY